MTQALARIITPVSEETYLSAFLRELERHLNPQPRVTQELGGIVWQGIPATRIVADGVWPIMIKVAEKIETSLSTERDAVKTVAPVVDRILTVGLFLRHRDPDQAAHACAEIVIRALANAKPVDGLVPHALWTKPVAQFFAQAFLQGREFGEAMMAEATERSKENGYAGKWPASMSRHDTVALVELAEVRDTAAALAACTSFHKGVMIDEHGTLGSIRHGFTPSLKECWPFLGVPKQLVERRLAQHVCAKLPCHLDRLPGDAIGTEYAITIEHGWINTQILLAALDAPFREYLDSHEETTTALESLFQLGTKDAAARTLARLRKNGLPALTLEEDTWLSAHLVESAKELIADAKKGHAPGCLQRNVAVKHDRAQAIAIAEGELTSDLSSPALFTPAYWEEVDSHLDWPTLSANKVISFIRAGSMPFPYVEQGLAKASAEVRLDVIRNVASGFSADVWNRFNARGWLPEDPEFYVKNRTLLPASVFPARLELILDYLADDTYGSEENLEILFEIVTCLSDHTALKRFAHAPLREALALVVLSDSGGIASHIPFKGLKNYRGYRVLEPVLGGEEGWRKIILGALALFREEPKGQARKSRISAADLEEPMASWDKLATSEEGFDFERILDLDKLEATKFLVKYPEKEILRWLREKPAPKPKKTVKKKKATTKRRAKPRRR